MGRGNVDVSVSEYLSLENDFVQTVLPMNRARHAALSARIDGDTAEVLKAETLLHQLRGEPHSSALLQQMGNLQTNIKQLSGQRTQHMCIRACLLISAEALQVQFGRICATPRIRKVWVAYGRLIYETLPLYGKDHGNEWRRIGRFQISFDLAKPVLNNFTWINLDGRKDHWHGPPNIIEPNDAEYGVVSCAGDAQGVIDSANQSFDYPALVAFSIRYPECAGAEHNDTIKYWDRVPVEDVPRWYIEAFGA